MTAWLKKITVCVANTDKNNGLILVIRVNKKPEIIGNQFIVNVDLFVISLGLNDLGTWWDSNLSQHYYTIP